MEDIFAIGDKKRVREHGLFVDLESLNPQGYTLVEAKSMLFLSQIFHLLLPKNSPQPIRVRKVKGQGYAVAFEKIVHDPLHSQINAHRVSAYKFWEKRRGVAIPIKDPGLVEIQNERSKLWDKLGDIEKDPAFKKLFSQIQEYGFGDLYELSAVNFIKDEVNNEYIFIDPEPAIQQLREKGSLRRLGIPKVITKLRIPFDQLEVVIHEKLKGNSRKIGLEYLQKLRGLLPKRYENVFAGHHESGVVVLRH